MKLTKIIGSIVILGLTARAAMAADPGIRERVRALVDGDYTSLFQLYTNFHAHPELSREEKATSALLEEQLRKAGFTVTSGVGKYGVVALLRNGSGPTVLVRSDMDGLPVKEQTGLPYASTVVTKDSQGKEVPVMHACGHDLHMTSLTGTARVLAQLKEEWHGTLMLIGQPAEEVGTGARAMLKDGFYDRFPHPDFCLALHDDSELPAGAIGYTSGAAMANVDSVDITVYGQGGHGARPHTTKDPIVLASQIVLALQTIVSREVRPGEPVVVTVGSIHGGTKHNIISDQVRLQLTVRSFSDEVRKQTLDSIRRIVRNQALSAGLPEDRLPLVTVGDEFTKLTYNDPALASRVVSLFKQWFGEKNLVAKPPSTGGEDFGEFSGEKRSIPIFMFTVGGVDPKAFAQAMDTSRLPSLHSPFWAPVPETTLKTGITAMTAAVLDLMRKQ